MALGRISTYSLHQSTLRDATRVQFDLANLQIQMASGLKSQDFKGLGDQAQQFLALENRLSRSDTYIKNNKLVETRLNVTNTVLDQFIDTANKIKNNVLLRRNESVENGLAFPTQLEQDWKSLVTQLNTTHEGRYLFSGTRTDTPAVDASTFPVLSSSGGVNDYYYLGSKEDVTLHADDATDITYNVRADSPGFQKIFAGLAKAKQGDLESSDALLAEAFDMIQSGIDDVISAKAVVNTNQSAIASINERHTSLQIYWKTVKDEIGNTDYVTASTQFALDQAILTASFQTLAAANRLRLSDFL